MMIFRTATKEYRGATAAGVIRAISRDATCGTAARRPAFAFLESWIAQFDARAAVRADAGDASAEAVALELLYLCQAHRLGVLARDEGGKLPNAADEV
jgi:hypothetical protein